MTDLKSLPISMSTEGTQGTKTGRWGLMQPRFKERPAPCRQGCPGSIHIPKFIQRIQESDWEGAWRVILENNPLPRVTGRVCFHPCEQGCNRKDYDDAIGINALERFVGDWAFENGLSAIPKPATNGHKVAVIGAGPAGIGCAFYLLKQGHRVSLFEAQPEIGGLLRYGIPDYRLPKKILSEELDLTLGSTLEIHKNVRVGIDISWDEIISEYQGIFLGTGAQSSIKLGLAGEGAEGIREGLPFLQNIGENIPFEAHQKVLIIGGGNTALDVARTVLRLKGTPLIVYRRTRTEMPAFEDEIREAEEEGIEIRFLVSPIAVVRDGDKVKGLECLKNRITNEVDAGRRRPEPIEGSEFLLEGDLVISALGQRAAAESIPPAIVLEKDAVVVAEGGFCGSQGIYAGGDVTAAPRSVIHALASGKQAASALSRYLQKEESGATDKEEGAAPVAIAEINLAYFDHASGAKPPVQPAKKRISGFEEVTHTVSPDDAGREAARCFGCGSCNTCGNCYFFCPDFAVHRDPKTLQIVIDDDYCKGCCICVEECPRSVLSAEVKR